MKTVRFAGMCALAAVLGCVDNPTTVLERLQEARRLASEALVEFTKAADASNRAVLADTEERVSAARREVEQSSAAVDSCVKALGPLLNGLQYTTESQLLEEFEPAFSEYRELDGTILEMVVDASNLKAQRLAFGPAQQQADALRDALEPLSTLSQNADRDSDAALAATVMSSVREIQALQAPHIAETTDEVMDRIEQRMANAEATTRGALTKLSQHASPAMQPQIAAAGAAFDEFMKLNREIITLSRRNSNVHALALSLGQKRALVASCEDRLRALQDALAKRGFTATR